MTVPPDSMAVATHWPFVRRHLTLARARPARLALDALAELQFHATGELVRLGRARLRRELKLTAGEAGAVYNALCELERRGVVTRLRDAGNRADAWGFRPDLRRWRAMPWRTSSRDVGTAVGACICSTNRAFAARIPGQGLTGAPHFWLSAEDHIAPPGLFLVDSRGNGAGRAATARRPGEMPVDSRGNGAAASAPVLSFLEDVPSSSSDVHDDERVSILRSAVGQCWGAPLRKLCSIAAGVTIDQAHAMAQALEAYRLGGQPVRSPQVRVELLEELAASPAVRAMAQA